LQFVTVDKITYLTDMARGNTFGDENTLRAFFSMTGLAGILVIPDAECMEFGDPNTQQTVAIAFNGYYDRGHYVGTSE